VLINPYDARRMPAPDKILRLRTVLERAGLSRSTIYRKIEEGTFPRQVRISEHCCGWRESDLSRWIGDPQGYAQNSSTGGRGAPAKLAGQQPIASSVLQTPEDI
jgi:prophage regulatory protein